MDITEYKVGMWVRLLRLPEDTGEITKNTGTTISILWHDNLKEWCYTESELRRFKHEKIFPISQTKQAALEYQSLMEAKYELGLE